MNTKIIKLDLNKSRLYEKIKAKQGDTESRFLLFQLFDGALPFSLKNRSVRAYMIKPDSKEVFNDLIINDRIKGYCTLELTNQVLAAPGTVKIELMITEGTKKLTSSVFELEVDKSINSEKSIVSTNEFTALLNGLASLSEYDNYKNELKDARDGEVNVGTNIRKIKSQLDTIVREEIEIDLLNPPKNTGLLPLTNNPIENSERLQNIFNYVKQNEISYQPNNRQYTGYTYKIKFPTGTIVLENTVDIKGSYLNLDGDRTIIKCNNGVAFNVASTNFRKALVTGLTFDSCNAFNINKDNIDCGMVTFDNCWFFKAPGDAFMIIDQSAHYTFNKCHFYACKYIANIINVDHTTFRDCWFSELPRETDGEASFVLKGTYTNFENCMFIPSGYDRNEVITNEPNLNNIAWINAYGSVVVDGCRVSAEPNNKTLINCYSKAKLTSPYEPNSIEVKNCYRLCCTKGNSIINLFAIPNKINITNNSFGIADEKAIKYSENYNVNDDPALRLSGEELNKVEIKIENNIGQNSQVADIPFELKKFLKINEVQTGLIYKDGTLYSKKKGETVNQSVKVETNYQYNEVKICNSIYKIKMSWQTDSTFSNSRSVYMGFLSFVSKKSSDGNIVEAVLTPIVSLQGGSYTSQQNLVNINVLFGKSGKNSYIPTSGDLEKINIYISVASEIVGEAKFTIEEVTDGQFLM